MYYLKLIFYRNRARNKYARPKQEVNGTGNKFMEMIDLDVNNRRIINILSFDSVDGDGLTNEMVMPPSTLSTIYKTSVI